MRAHGRSVGGGIEFYDRAEKKNFAAYVISAELLHIWLSGLLGVGRRDEAQNDPKRNNAQSDSVCMDHFPSHLQNSPATFPRCGGPNQKKASRRKPKGSFY